MKQFYFKSILTFCVFFTIFSQAQIYNINSSGSGTCPSNSGIDATFACTSSNNALALGSFTDINDAGAVLSSMELDIYGACDGAFELFINGTSILTGSESGLTCNCQSIASDPNIPQSYTISITPDIAAAYVMGGINTLSVVSLSNVLCYYGADVTVVTVPLGVDDFEFNRIKTYPNPALDFITVTGLTSTENFRIYDVFGAEVLKGTSTANGKINIQNLTSGLYFLKFERRSTLKIIKK